MRTPHRLFSNRPLVSFRSALIGPFVLQIIGVVAIVGYLSYRSGYQSIEALAFQFMESVDRQIHYKLDSYLQEAHEFNRRQAAAVASGATDPQALDSLHRYLMLQHRQHQELTTLLFGTPEGDLRVSHHVISRDYGGATLLRSDELPFEAAISESSEPSINRTYGTDEAGNIGRYLETLENIDVRDRLWYRQAVETGQAGWTKPIQIGRTDHLALNAYLPTYDESDQLLGVFAVNISLYQLSNFLEGLDVGPSGDVFIIERDGLLIADSTPDAAYTTVGELDLDGTSEPGLLLFERRSPDEVAQVTIQQAYQYLQQTFDEVADLQSPQKLQFSIQGSEQYLIVSPYQDDYGLDWLVVTVIPATHFMADIQENVRTTVFLCLLALGGAIAFSTVLARRMTARLKQLNEASQVIADGDLTQLLPTNSVITEVHGLAQSFNQMAKRLQQLFQNQIKTEGVRQSEARFQRLAGAVPGVIYSYTHHADGRDEFEYISFSCRDIFELEPAQILADSSLATHQIHPEDRSAYDAAFSHSVETLTPFDADCRIITPSGQLKWLKVRSRPLAHPDGSVTCYGIVMDVSDRKHVETALQESELRYRIMAESAPVGIFRHDKQGRCIDANTKTLEITGLSLQEVLKDEWGKRLHPGDRDRVDAAWQSFMRQVNQGKSATYETEQRYVYPDGSCKWALARAVPERNTAGEVSGFVGSVADITDLKQTELALQAKTEELDRFFSVAIDLLCIANIEGEFLRLNPQWEKTLGYSLEDLEGSKFLDYVHPDDLDSTLEAIAQLSAQVEIPSFVNRYRCQDGSYRWIEWRSVPIGSIIYAAARDITDRKRVEEDLKHSKKVAEHANKAKSQFLANMSHELRTPLNAILGFSELMQYDSDLEPTYRHYVSLIHNSGESLLKLISEVLDLSKVEAGKITLNYQKTDLHQKLHLISETLSEQIHRKNLQFHLEIGSGVPQTIWIDDQKLEQVLLNLLSNAVKFTKQGAITLCVSQRVDENARVLSPSSSMFLTFQVQDTGVGIAPEDLEMIFDPFTQAAAGQQALQGTGLGLVISRRIVQLMGGDILVESAEGQGSTFQFTLPVNAIANVVGTQPP